LSKGWCKLFRVISLVLALFLSLGASEALDAFKAKDYTKAFKLYKQRADSGDTSAQSALSYLYANGLGVAQDRAKSIEYLTLAADGGLSSAQYDLGMFYLRGDSGVSKDLAKAHDYLTKASDGGNIEAKYNLALMYYNGDGVNPDINKAATLLEEAAKLNHPLAKANIGKILAQQLKFEDAIKWLEINASEGDSSSYFPLAQLYIELEDFKSAKKWAYKALETKEQEARLLIKEHNLDSY